MPVAKRSPILGFNHNVRYRGLVFHVQTEDSGVMSPHLFTHCFYGGVIIMTHKLVYDAGSGEDSIKALMQAQHKRVLKELKKGGYDDKIDLYLGTTPGLEPRRSAAVEAELDDAPSAPVVMPPPEAAPVAIDKAEPSEVIELTMPARTKTADRTSPASAPMLPPLPSDDIDAPTYSDQGSISEAVRAVNLAPEPPRTQTREPELPVVRIKTPQKVVPPPGATVVQPRRPGTPPPVPQRTEAPHAGPEISLVPDDTRRNPRDTAVDEVPLDLARSATDSIPPLPPTPDRRPPTIDRPASHNAAALPPARPASRPAITPPLVVSRPITSERKRPEQSDAVEVYAPAPPSAELPGDKTERPGQYSVQRSKQQSSQDLPQREPTGKLAVPAGLGRPRIGSGAIPKQDRSRTASAPPPPPAPPPSPAKAPPPSNLKVEPGRVTTPPAGSRAPNVTTPIASRTPPAPGSGVVMTRPAVIVGSPQKPPGAQPPRVRKAREDEGRGFGSGLISEKSLDEVILAYLSEDADDK